MMKVSDIMTRDVVTVRNSAPVLEAVHLMRKYQIQALVVEKSHDLDKDVVKYLPLRHSPLKDVVFAIPLRSH